MEVNLYNWPLNPVFDFFKHCYLQAVVFANPEEELIVAESELCIDYEVDSSEEDDSALGTEGVEMKPWRRFES